MSAVAAKLIEECRFRGISLRAGEGGKLKVRHPPERLPTELREELKRHKPELLRLLTTEPPKAKTRPFLSRPRGQEEALDPWEVWTPLFDWLIEYHPEHFHVVCDAEDKLNEMGRHGITGGSEYEAACRDLYVKFETARRLRLKAEVRVWIQFSLGLYPVSSVLC